MKYLFHSVILILCIISCACNSSKQTAKNNALKKSEKTVPEIAFLYFEIEKRDETTDIRFIESKVREGVLKYRGTNIRNRNYVLVASFYAGNQFLFEQSIEHPLKRSFEFSHDKDAKLETFTKNLDVSTFSIRIQKDPKITEVRFKEVINAKETILKTIPISF